MTDQHRLEELIWGLQAFNCLSNLKDRYTLEFRKYTSKQGSTSCKRKPVKSLTFLDQMCETHLK